MSPRTLTLITLAALAVLLYVIGFKTGMFAVIIIAAVVELWFWIKLIVGDGKDQPPQS